MSYLLGRKAHAAFTVLELLLVCVITAVLVSFGYSAFEHARYKAESIACISNMRSLHVAFEGYLQDNNQVWPQPPPTNSLNDEAKWWMDTLKPYGPNQDTWRCRSRKRSETSSPVPVGVLPDIIDYLPALFDNKPGTAHRWSNQPWLIEVGDFHGGGNLILSSSGAVYGSKSGTPDGS